MLYDTRWEVKADPFSLDSLVAWLEKQPAAKVYCYADTGHCLLSQYFTAMGFELICMGSVDFIHKFSCADLHRADLPPRFNSIAVGHPQTFGKALARARKLRTP